MAFWGYIDRDMSKMENKLNIVSFEGQGRVLPHTLKDVQQVMALSGHRVFVLDMRNQDRYRSLVAFADTMYSRRPDVLFTIDLIGLLPLLLAVMQKPPQVVAWLYDSPERMALESFLCIRDHLHLFLWDRDYVKSMKDRGFRHVYYQPFGTNPLVYHPVAEPLKPLYDVSFVGSWSEERADIIRQIADAGIWVDVFGNDPWSMLKHANVRYHGFASNRTDCPNIYRQSTINLNITSEQLLSALPVRIFDVLGCGGFLMTDWRADIDRLFSPGRELVVYEDVSDLIKKIHYYLKNPQERQQLAASGKKRVINEYTFQRIVPTILQRVGERRLGDGSGAQSMKSGDYARAAWIMGVSALKFGASEEAARLLGAVCRMCSKDDVAWAACALFEARVGNVQGVNTCFEQLQALNSVWVQRRAAFDRIAGGGPIEVWDALYSQFFNLTPSAEGMSVSL